MISFSKSRPSEEETMAMPAEIVTDICPPPKWNWTEEEICEMIEALEGHYQVFGPAFERRQAAGNP